MRPLSTAPFPSLLSISSLTPASLRELLDESHALKKLYKSASSSVDKDSSPPPKPLDGVSVAMIFEKRSTRTRVSTETGLSKLGAHPLFLSSQDIQLNVNESIRDTAEVMGRYNDIILARVNSNETIRQLEASVPGRVVNALCDLHHPLQTLADLMTLEEKWGRGNLSGKTLAWVGDGNNVIHDLMLGMLYSSGNVRIATPPGYECDPGVVKTCKEFLGEDKSSKLFFTNDPKEAVKGADVVVTDTWVSMGQEDEYKKKVAEFDGYQVTESLLEGANNGALFMHCLPRHPEEVDDEVFYGDRSVVFDEAENRMWTVMAVIMRMRGKTYAKNGQ